MIKATFYCRIETEDGEVREEDFNFDDGVFETQEELDRYIKDSEYVVGEPCGYWGNDVGILTKIFIDKDY